MIMISLNSLVRQKVGLQGEEEEEAEGRRRAGLTGIPTPGVDAPIGRTRSGVSDKRKKRKHGRWYGFPLHKRQ